MEKHTISFKRKVYDRLIKWKQERNGVTRIEMVEAITHAAFYAGWPNKLKIN